MKSENLFKNILSIFAIFILILSSFNFLFVVVKSNKDLTGHATSFVNISISPLLEINLSQNIVNWSSGTVNSGNLNATLYTNGSGDGFVLRGNWTGVGVRGFVVENVGSINCSLNIEAGKNASALFSSFSNSNQQYQWNVSNKESGACLNATGGPGWNTWVDVNTTSSGTKICNSFGYLDNSDEIYIDVLLTIPSDAQNIGSVSDTISVTCSSV